MLGAASPDSRHSPGTRQSIRLGGYELLEEIGRGGMGRVWRAHQASLSREVAIKTLRGGASAGPIACERFRREAMAVARLRHPGIVTLHEVGEIEGELFLVLELVKGETLADRLREGPLAGDVAAATVCAVAEAVEHAHSHGVVHRDLKPSNILLDEEHQDVPRLTDFGVALLADREAVALTATLEGLGTLAYLAPEQATGGRELQGPATDVYGLGAVLYHCLTGRAPFLGESPAAVLRDVSESDPPSPRLINPRISADLETICLKCLEKEPKRRYGTAVELRDDLSRYLRGEPVLARPVSAPGRFLRWVRRKPALAFSALGTLAILLLGLATTSWQWLRAEKASGLASIQLTKAWNEQAQALFAAGDARDAMASLARTLKWDPANRSAMSRMVAGLTQRQWARPVYQLGDHPGYILQTAWSPDGKTILTAGDDGLIQAWFAADGRRLTNRWLVKPKESWLAFGFSPNGIWISSLQENGALDVFGREGGPPVFRLGNQGSKVLACRWHPDSSRIAVVREDRSLEVWSVGSAYCEHRWVHPAAVRDLDFPRNGRWLVTAAEDGVARVFDVQTGLPSAPEIRAAGSLRGARWDPEGSYLALTTETNHTVEVWEWPSGRRRFQQRHDAIEPACFTPNGLVLRFTASTRIVSAVRPATGRDQFRIPRIKYADFAWGFSPDWRFGLVTGDGLNLLPYSLTDGVPLTEPIRVRWAAEAAAFSPDGGRLVIAAGTNVATVWQLASPQPSAGRVRMPQNSLDLQFVPGSRLVRTCDAEGTVRDSTWSADSVALRRLKMRDLALAQFSKDATKVAAIDSSGSVSVFEAESARRLAGPWKLPEGATRAAFSRNGQWLGIGTTAERLVLFDLGNDRQSAAIDLRSSAPSPGLGSKVLGVEFDPASGHVLACTYGGAVQVISVADSVSRLNLPHATTVVTARYSDDGRKIATACLNGVVQIWDASNGHPVGPPLVHEDSALDAKFTPRGDMIITAAQDHAIRGWEVGNGRLLWRANTAADPLQLAINASGTQVAAVTGGNGNRVWEIGTGVAVTERLAIPSGANRTLFSPDGQEVAFWFSGASAYLFPVPVPPPGPAPLWLSDLAEAVVGLRYGANGERQVVSVAERFALETRLSKFTEPHPFWRALLERIVKPPEAVLQTHSELSESDRNSEMQPIIDPNTEPDLN